MRRIPFVIKDLSGQQDITAQVLKRTREAFIELQQTRRAQRPDDRYGQFKCGVKPEVLRKQGG